MVLNLLLLWLELEIMMFLQRQEINLDLLDWILGAAVTETLNTACTLPLFYRWHFLWHLCQLKPYLMTLSELGRAVCRITWWKIKFSSVGTLGNDAVPSVLNWVEQNTTSFILMTKITLYLKVFIKHVTHAGERNIRNIFWRLYFNISVNYKENI